MAKRASEEISIYISNSCSVLEALAQTLGQFNIPVEKQKVILSHYVLHFPAIDQIHIIDNKGRELISTGGKSSHVDWTKYISLKDVLTGTNYKSDVFISSNLIPSMFVAVPIRRSGQITGAAIGEINLISMWKLVDRMQIGRTGYTYVVARDGTLVAHGLKDGKAMVFSHKNLSFLKIVQEVLKGKVSMRTYKNITGEKVIGIAVPVMPLGWGIVIEEPVAEAYASTRHMTLYFSIMTLVFTGGVTLFGYRRGQEYILNPLRVLIEATRKISKGDLNTRVNISTGDELEEVGKAFNSMMEEISRMQEEIKRDERIIFMGKISAGLVHDLRHPIRNIENASKLILRKYHDPEVIRTFSNIVKRECININRLLDDLLNISRPVHIRLVSCNLCKEINNILAYFRDDMTRHGIQLEFHSPDNVQVVMDKFLMERVFKNIVMNAIEAMNHGGMLKIHIGYVDRGVEITFTDTGPGIPEEHLANIFTKFVTTKRRGIGLGLPVSKRIIDAHGGDIMIESEKGKGTTVRIILPVQV